MFRLGTVWHFAADGVQTPSANICHSHKLNVGYFGRGINWKKSFHVHLVCVERRENEHQRTVAYVFVHLDFIIRRYTRDNWRICECSCVLNISRCLFPSLTLSLFLSLSVSKQQCYFRVSSGPKLLGLFLGVLINRLANANVQIKNIWI